MIKKRLIPVCIMIGLFAGCTSNSILDDDDPVHQLTVTGTVRLSDGEDPSYIFIWLEEFDLSSWTNDQGGFSITLPPPPSQPGGGLTGEFRLFCYVGNYEVSISTLVLQHGNILYDSDIVDDQGRITPDIVLQKLAHIRSVVVPPEITQYDSTTVRVDFTVTPLVPRVRIQTYRSGNSPNDPVQALFFREVGTTETRFITSSVPPLTETITSPRTFSGGVKTFWLQLELLPTTFEAFPCIRFLQDDLPDDLVTAISERAGEYHVDYLDIPFRQDYGTLLVKPASTIQTALKEAE